jgi:hypothetical protein
MKLEEIMSLIEGVEEVLHRLAQSGWATLLAKHGLDITSTHLRSELDRELPGIDREVPGFEDFAFEGLRGIEPGNPSRSLLYHALASPNVLHVDGADLGAYPTLAEIDAVENYVFGAKPPSLQELSALAAGDFMAVVVFASEYRPAIDTVHRRHAELCFSRTGIARVGTADPLYDPRARGFSPLDGDDMNGFRVLPARYSPYIAVQRRGSETSFGPMRFNFRLKHPELYGPEGSSDVDRKFWVPLHKLFSGDECLQQHHLDVSLTAHHVNEKIRRIHMALIRRGFQTGWSAPDIDLPPFRFSENIASFSRLAESGSGVLVPDPHSPMVEAARYKGKALTFIVPSVPDPSFSPTLIIESEKGGERPAPEYVHVRHAPGSATPNLNDSPDAVDTVNAGGYRAQHYVDFTGDGWVEASCPQIRPLIPRFISAYSIVTAPDFFFSCDQREVMDWWFERAPEELRDFLWRIPPLTLSDERLAPNLKLNNTDFHAGDLTFPTAHFRPEDDTVAAIVSMTVRGAVQDRPLKAVPKRRHTHLPDGAAGVFAPGWDTSHDKSGDVLHLASYGLGSPFPEDSKLCAALSTFWPAVAPDAGRSFSDVFPSVAPLTDEEIGIIGSLPWDGVPGPILKKVGGKQVVEYANFPFVDYIETALANKFSLALTASIDTPRYVSRVLATARVYRALGVQNPNAKDQWNVLSFLEIDPANAELQLAQSASGVQLAGDLFRFEMYKHKDALVQPSDHRKAHKTIASRTVLFVGGNPGILLKRGNAQWVVVNV